MTWWEAALLGLVQGLTEFLPVSSSGHLVLGQHFLGLESDDITFEVFVHFGTVLSIATVYWSRIVNIGRETWIGVTQPSRLALNFRILGDFRTAVLILVTMIPTGIIYLLFRDWLEAAFAHPRLAASMLLVTGTLLILTVLRRHPSGDVSPLKALVIGAAQGAAMIPGISRSGATICTAIYQNVTPEKAANFSFLMSLPVIVAATGIEALRIFDVGFSARVVPLAIGTVVAYAAGIVAIKVVLDFVRRGNLRYFAYYCFAIGTLGILFI